MLYLYNSGTIQGCTIKSGGLVLKEHEAVKWLTKDELDSVDWLPADLELIHKLWRLMERN